MTGTALPVIDPSPSWPDQFDPQHHATPEAVKAHACELPVVILAKLVGRLVVTTRGRISPGPAFGPEYRDVSSDKPCVTVVAKVPLAMPVGATVTANVVVATTVGVVARADVGVDEVAGVPVPVGVPDALGLEVAVADDDGVKVADALADTPTVGVAELVAVATILTMVQNLVKLLDSNTI